MRAIDADRLKEHIDKLPALPDGNFAGNHSALKALINMQPSVEPERKRGKWIRTIDPDVNAWTGGHICSECGRACVQMSMKYCANCGAPMEVETDHS